MFTDPEDFFDVTADPSIDLKDLTFLTEEAIMVGYSPISEEFQDTLKNGNVVIAAFTTAQARLKLYTYLEKLGARVIYMDTGKSNRDEFSGSHLWFTFRFCNLPDERR